jgi:hypothetical protein
MKNYRRILLFTGSLAITTGILHAVMGLSPTTSLYFGAPEKLVQNSLALIISCLIIGITLVIFGLYAISGAGYIRPLPYVKKTLLVVSILFTLRGILFIPELMIISGFLEVRFPVAPRYPAFSLGILFIGLMYLLGTIGGWHSFPPQSSRSRQEAGKRSQGTPSALFPGT